MSRIGKLPISIPAGVTITVSDDNKVTVKGPKGEMSQVVDPSIKVNIADAEVTFEIVEENDTVETKQKQAFHGLYRSLINNMVVGVSEGYKKQLELVGVGYRVSNQGNLLEFALGYTHPILFQLPSEIKVETKSERNQNPQIILESCDKQLLGQVCAKIRSFRKPEPYKGKGISTFFLCLSLIYLPIPIASATSSDTVISNHSLTLICIERFLSVLALPLTSQCARQVAGGTIVYSIFCSAQVAISIPCNLARV